MVVDSNIVLTFSEAIAKGKGTIAIHSGSATGPVVETYDTATNTSNLTVSGSTLTINPSANLSDSTHYFVTIDSGSINDLAGNHYAGTSTYDFTTADITPPTVTTFAPTNSLTGVAVDSNIVLTFSEAIQKGAGSIVIHSDSATGPVVASYDATTSGNLLISGNTLTIHHSDLANSTHYFVTLDSGSIKDIAGNTYAGTSSYDFTTVAAGTTADTTPPTVTTFSPSDAAIGVVLGSDIVLAFSEAIQKGAGSIVIHSDSATGPVVASYDAATSGNLLISGNTLTIHHSDLANSTHYFVTLDSGSIKDITGNTYTGTSSYDFTTVAAGTTADTTPPTVTSYNPAGADTGIGINSDILLTFSETVQKGTGIIAIHSGSATGTVVATSDDSMTVDISISGSTLTINPTHDLSYGTHYYVTLSDGSVKDIAGNSYAGTSAYDFTTVMPPNVTPASNGGNSTGVALAGVGILGILAWVIF